ncbi:hypothetical protein C7120_11510 [Prevotella sp. oral taxon 376]|uniref:hypothetical protein n=1 Tax=Prevotella sp. oral taxon 376 TaxID=712466 RepID=UPI000D1F738E|nr:hypothetical protein [Prevotella sp. oral taxon 376]PTL32894.1 hypothetical protein C7120_11510 [Prevotella sp. oral taxon 376]
MMKTTKRLLLALFLTAVVVSCGDKSQKEFGRLLTELAGQDETVDRADWQRIADFLDKNKAHFSDLYDGNGLKAEAVKEYIQDFFDHRRPAKDISFAGIDEEPLSFRIFLEQSGSMTPYDSPSGDGSFKAAVMALQNNLPGKAEVEHIGEKGYTDFRSIFDDLLNNTKENEISILVTDMIYSVKDMQGVNPQKVFSEAQGMINSVFKEAVEKKAMLVVKMNASYNGPYYSYDNSVRQYNGRRPYYIVVVGDNRNMSRLTHDRQLAAFADFKALRGYENMYLYEARHLYAPYYSLLLSNDDIRGRFQPERGQESRITSIGGVELDKNSGDLQLALAVDLSGMLIDERYLTDASNYEVESSDAVKIRKIRRVTPKDATPAERRYLGKSTHIFVLSMGGFTHDQEVKIKLMNRLPKWIAESSTDNDLCVDSHTTFGLRYLLEGIYDSYKHMSDGEPEYFEFELNLER